MPGGRPKGSVSINKQALIKLLEKQYPGWQPVSEMVRAAIEIGKVAERTGEKADWESYCSACNAVAKYTTPQLKAVEVEMDATGDLRIGWCDSHTIQSEAATGDST